LIPVFRKNFVSQFCVIFGTLSFPMLRTTVLAGTAAAQANQHSRYKCKCRPNKSEQTL